MMIDTLGIIKGLPPTPQKISVQTPIGSIETGDDNPFIDVLIIVLIFFAFCVYVFARYFNIKGKG